MMDRPQESYCSLVKVTVRGDEEPLLYRGGLTLLGIDKPAAVSHCPLIVRSTPWLLITIQKWLIFFFWSHYSSFEIVQRHFSVSFYSLWWNCDETSFMIFCGNHFFISHSLWLGLFKQSARCFSILTQNRSIVLKSCYGSFIPLSNLPAAVSYRMGRFKMISFGVCIERFVEINV